MTTHKKCRHGKRNTRCVKCGGKELCVHGKVYFGCKECYANALCIHGKYKDKCWLCSKQRWRFCSKCQCNVLSSVRLKNKINICKMCESYETKMERVEHKWKKLLESNGFYTSVHDEIIRSSDCSIVNKRRVDLLYLTPNEVKYNILVEIDEFEHSSISPSCEFVRLQDIHDQIISACGTTKPLFVIRFNPYAKKMDESQLLSQLLYAIKRGLACRSPCDTRGILVYSNLIGYSVKRKNAYKKIIYV